MAGQIVLNLLLAAAWMMFSNEFSIGGFIVGYSVGLAILFLLRRFIGKPLYFRKIWAAVKLLGLFFKELIVSNFAVARQVVRPRLSLRPGVFEYQTELRSDWEVTLLACLITLTPGTLSLEVSPEQDTLYIHAIDIENAGEMRDQIRNTFERAIREVTE